MRLKISGYEITRSDRFCNGGSGWGVWFYIRSEISYSVRTDLNNHLLESLSIEIRQPRSKPFVVTTWYIPPDSLVDIFGPFEALIGKLVR